MTPSLWGALAGLVMAGMSFLSLWLVAGNIEKNAKTREALRSVGIIKAVALVDIVLFPLLGYWLGPKVM